MKLQIAKTLLIVATLVLVIACGSPKTATPTPGPNPSTLPQVSGEWLGGMNFTTVSGDLVINLTEDASGNVAGTAVSNPPDCQFSLPVSGKVYSNGQVGLQTADGTTIDLAGTLSSNDTALSGNINLGGLTGCGPRTGGTFNLAKGE
jgi:hypothetical protein